MLRVRSPGLYQEFRKKLHKICYHLEPRSGECQPRQNLNLYLEKHLKKYDQTSLIKIIENSVVLL